MKSNISSLIINHNSTPPIFIHSLFRAGSTYLFAVFRRSQVDYCCYQEPLHEVAFFSRNDSNLLQVDHRASKTVQLRHPHIEEGYFHELQDVWPAWREKITDLSIYANYFAPPDTDIGIPYWQSLIEASKERPVFQECRTGGRIGAIKAGLGGYHVYLWRNPWDQWWSYKVTPYFDKVNQLIVRASGSPTPVTLLRSSLGMKDDAPVDLAEALNHFGARSLSSEHSYLVFYMLWCLGMREGMTHAHLMLNIDRLSDSPLYRTEIKDALANAGIFGIDFADCHMPQSPYLEQDRAFFEPLEAQVHRWLLDGGWMPAQLAQVQSMRQQFVPISWGAPITSCVPADLAEQASRARALARRLESYLAESVSTFTRQNAELEVRAKQVETRANKAAALVQQVEARITELESNLASADFRASEAEQQVAVFSLRAAESEVRERDLLNSASWKITAPLRYLASLLLNLRNKLNQSQVANSTTAMRGLPPLAMRTWAGLEKYQHLRLFILGTLRHFPSLDFKLRRMYEQSMFKGQLPATDWPGVENGSSDQLSKTVSPDGIRRSVTPSLEFGQSASLISLSSGMNASQRPPLEANFFNYLVRR